jgi:hypothetical protein
MSPCHGNALTWLASIGRRALPGGRLTTSELKAGRRGGSWYVCRAPPPARRGLVGEPGFPYVKRRNGPGAVSYEGDGEVGRNEYRPRGGELFPSFE